VSIRIANLKPLDWFASEKYQSNTLGRALETLLGKKVFLSNSSQLLHKKNRNNASKRDVVVKLAEDEEEVVVETKAAQAVVFSKLWPGGIAFESDAAINGFVVLNRRHVHPAPIVPCSEELLKRRTTRARDSDLVPIKRMIQACRKPQTSL